MVTRTEVSEALDRVREALAGFEPALFQRGGLAGFRWRLKAWVGALYDRRAAAFDEHDVAPYAVMPADAFARADDAEARLWCTARLLVFSGKMPDWMVQMPAASVEAINAFSNAVPTPRLRASGWT